MEKEKERGGGREGEGVMEGERECGGKREKRRGS